MPLYPTKKPRERAVAVSVTGRKTSREQASEYLDELTLLADTAGVDVVRRFTQERDRIHSASFIGSGKVSEISAFVRDEGISVVIFDDDLSPVQVRNLEKAISCKIIDRSGLILDIFAERASTKESMTQVELAQLEYLLPRLTRQWTHLSKQYGGVGTKGPGETQIETDRRAIRTRISHLREKLREISREREVQRKGRKGLPRVAMVGYTNAGKSTLLHQLSGARVLIEDRLFATLDTTVRQVKLSPSVTILLSDTVGFIRKLPSHLIASFRSTLAEATEADLLLHVIDVTHPAFREQISVVNETLESIHAAGKPVIPIFNKIDSLTDRAVLQELLEQYPGSIAVSASRGINIPALGKLIVERLHDDVDEEVIILKPGEHRTLARLREIADITGVTYTEDAITVTARISPRNSGTLRKILSSTTHRADREP